MRLSSIVFMAVFAAAGFFPTAGIGLVAAVLLLQICVHLIQVIAAYLPRNAICEIIEDRSFFFSVHIATCNEPPSLVIATLKMLALQKRGTFDMEVIVVDNNTHDVALWHPVAAYCNARPELFKFLHFDRLEGAKAGALNVALSHACERTTHIVTVDADYHVAANFLQQAAAGLRWSGADFLQFPQAYRYAGTSGEGLSLEFADYFHNYARPSNSADAMLLTGTLSVIGKGALVAVGGWRSTTLTEDAELGVRLCANGYRGRFMDRIVGLGLMPFDLASLQKQRARWIKGNVQTILQPAVWRSFARRGGLDRRRRVLILSQLTAWLQFALVPAAALLSSLLYLAVAGPEERYLTLMMLASASLLLAVLAPIARIAVVRQGSPVGVKSTLSAMAARLALAPASARATIDALTEAGRVFEVTPKHVSEAFQWRVHPDHLLLFGAGLSGLACSVVYRLPLAILACFCLMALLPSTVVLTRDLERYRRRVMREE